METQEELAYEKLMSEMLKFFAMGCITGKSRLDTFNINDDVMTHRLNAITYITSCMSESFPFISGVGNNAICIIIAKTISNGFDNRRYPDLIKDFINIKDFEEVNLENDTISYSQILADIVMDNTNLMNRELANKYYGYVAIVASLYEKFKELKNIDIISNEVKKVIV